jgi:hypothetical protein
MVVPPRVTTGSAAHDLDQIVTQLMWFAQPLRAHSTVPHAASNMSEIGAKRADFRLGLF